ncbi:hypothetical protein CE91St41_26830 [Oscillospiraceae bacterium]|nr:hypothetical protein CE91St40_10710 [Oscillospiraceae bacterium]BDF75794.1 hypothetical protein CE91St41_26830 [Oscillospiraceae bacterium]
MNDKEKAIEAIAGLSEEQAQKVLIFMAGLQAGQKLDADAMEALEEPKPST